MAKQKSNESFDNIANSLGSEFEGEELVEEFSKELEKVDVIKDKVKKSTMLDTFVLDDILYLETEIKNTVDGLKTVSNKLEEELRAGSKITHFEVYGTLANSKIAALKELRELRKIMLDVKMKLVEINAKKKEPKEGNKKLTVNNYNLSNKEMAEMLKKAKENNSLDKIDANFDVNEDKNAK